MTMNGIKMKRNFIFMSKKDVPIIILNSLCAHLNLIIYCTIALHGKKASCALHYYFFNSIKSQLIEFIRFHDLNAHDNKSHSTVNEKSPNNHVHHTENKI